MKPNKYNYNNQTGMYREKILIRQRIVTQDDLLQDKDDYDDYGTFWAMVKTSDNNEEVSNGSEKLVVKKRYVLKYSKRLEDFINAEKTSFEIVHKGVIFDVKKAIDDNDLHETITVFVEGRV